MNLNIYNNYNNYNLLSASRTQSSTNFKANSIKMVKDLKLANLYGTDTLGKVKLKDELVDVTHTGNEFFTLNKDGKMLGFMYMSPRMYNGKTCYSCGELRNDSDKKGVGTKLLQIGLKAHKDSGKTGEFRVHDVLLEAEEFYEKLGFVEDVNRAEQWYLPFENEHILEKYNGGL